MIHVVNILTIAGGFALYVGAFYLLERVIDIGIRRNRGLR